MEQTSELIENQRPVDNYFATKKAKSETYDSTDKRQIHVSENTKARLMEDAIVSVSHGP